MSADVQIEATQKLATLALANPVAFGLNGDYTEGRGGGGLQAEETFPR
jgi:hypothetical protein